MTTNFLDNKTCTFTFLLSWRFPKKKGFWIISLSAPQDPPPQRCKMLFLLSSRCLLKKAPTVSGKKTSPECIFQANAKKHSKSTLWGTPRQVPEIAQEALRGALSGPEPGALL